jgi:hypothetical protein
MGGAGLRLARFFNGDAARCWRYELFMIVSVCCLVNGALRSGTRR